ncbi:MAG: DUF5677 domain-containing protein [Janthinobacterium lividum]
MQKQLRAPVGNAFHSHMRHLQDHCAASTWRALPKLGTKAPKAIRELGTVLSILDRMASCYWGCGGGHHQGEYLVGRAVNLANSAILLCTHGYYDEALTNARSLGELANLLALFAYKPEIAVDWMNADEKKRRKEFSAIKVRLMLEETGNSYPIKQDRYGALSGYSVHIDPTNRPQAHNSLDAPSSFCAYQEAGLLTCINEISLPIAFISMYGSVLVALPKPAKEMARNGAIRLADKIGGIVVTDQDQP